MENIKQKVAVVGAGISGVASAVHLHAEGLDVTVFERSSFAGGIWVFDERIPPEPRYPSVTPSTSDLSFFPNAAQKDLEDEETLKINHAPPGPCYESLHNNVSTFLLKLQNQPWKPDTEPIVRHNVLAEYIQDIPKREHIESLFRYDTRVADVSKHGKGWKVESETLERDESGRLSKKRRVEEFDAVVVASGHYHSCKIPDTPGLAALKDSFPNDIIHSKSYRRPDSYKDKNVLLVGAGVSSNDIAKDLAGIAKDIIQVSRNGAFDLPVKVLTPAARRVGAIESFIPTAEKDDGTLPTIVRLEDGTELTSIHKIIFCTGYFMTYPFLPQFHNDNLKPTEVDDRLLVTDGLQTHNLHKDIFYMPDPSLAFVGVPYNIATFSFFEFQAMLVAAVFAGKAKMPSEAAMREEYAARIKDVGWGRGFHSMHDRQREYVTELVEWVNKDGGHMEGHTAEWIEAHNESMRKMKELFGGFGRAGRPSRDLNLSEDTKGGENGNQKGWLEWAWSLIPRPI